MRKDSLEGYYIADEFYRYKRGEIDLAYLRNFPQNRFTEFEEAEVGNQINVKILNYDLNLSNFYFQTKYTFNIEAVSQNSTIVKYYKTENGEIYIPENAISENEFVDLDETTGGKFYATHHLHYTFQIGFQENEKKELLKILTKICFLIEHIKDDVFSKLVLNEPSGNEIHNLINNIVSDWKSEDETLIIIDSFTAAKEECLSYYNILKNFYNTLYFRDFTNYSGDSKIALLIKVLPTIAISLIPINIRILALNNLINSSFDSNEVIKILNSVTESQTNDFINALSVFNYVNGNGHSTFDNLFVALYNKFFSFLGIGDMNAWKDAMGILYNIWIVSDFNPYDILGNVKEEYPPIETLQLEKPPIINYESDSIALIFNSTNYDFKFRNKFIDIYPIDYVAGIIPQTLAYPVWSFTMFQPVVVQNSSKNTNSIKFLQVSLAENTNDEYGGVIPLFYLKFIDDIKYTDNIETSLEVTFDVALTFTGIGNISKLKHLRHINKLGRVALGLEASVPGQTLIWYELAQGGAGLIEISSSVASLWINHVNNYQNTFCNIDSPDYNQETCDWYRKFDNWMLFLQLKSGALDLAFSKAVKNGARDLLTSPPSNFEPEALAIVARFADQNFTDLKNLFQLKLTSIIGENSNIWNKLNDLPLNPVNKQEEFILDFQGAKKADLEKLNHNEAELFDYWTEIEHLHGMKRNILFLENYRSIKNLPELIEHAIRGSINRSKRFVGGHKAIEVDGINLRLDANTASLTDLTNPLPTNQFGVTKLQHEGVYKIEKFRNIYNAQGNIIGSKWVTKRIDPNEAHTFFPYEWGDQKIIEEFASALTNPNRVNFRQKQYGFKANSDSGVLFGWYYDLDGNISSFFPIF